MVFSKCYFPTYPITAESPSIVVGAYIAMILSAGDEIPLSGPQAKLKLDHTGKLMTICNKHLQYHNIKKESW